MAIVTPTEVQAALTTLTTAQIAELADVIAAATAMCESYCFTILDSRETSEVIAPESKRLVRLRNRPVSAVARLATGLAAVVRVAYAGAAGRATVALAGTGDAPYLVANTLNLTTVAGGATTTTPITLGTGVGQAATLADLRAAIGAVAGWTATVAAGMDGFATADLLPDLAQRSATGSGAALWAYATDLAEWDLDPERGELRFLADFFPAYRHPDRTWGGTPRSGRVWVRYTAGYVTPPADLKRAVIITAKSIFASELITGHFASEKSPEGYQYTLATTLQVVPATAQAILDRKYRVIRIS